MALFSKSAEAHVDLFVLNKRLVRIFIGVAVFFLIILGLLQR
jgi:hypothetical protein